MDYYNSNLTTGNNDYVGVLATDDDIQSHMGDYSKKSVFINTMNIIQYSVKALSVGAPTMFFTGYPNSILESDSLDLDSSGYTYDSSGYVYDYTDKRTAIFQEKVQDCLFVFNSFLASGKGDGRYYRINNANLVSRPVRMMSNDRFIAVPVFSPADMTSDWELDNSVQLGRSYNNYSSFLACIRDNRSVGRVSNFGSRDSTKFVVWYDDKEEGRFCAIGPFTSIEYTPLDGYVFQYEKIYEIDLSQYEEYMLYPFDRNPTVIHMIERIYETLSNQFVTKADTTPIALEEIRLPSPPQAPARVTPPVSSSNEDLIDIDPTKKDDVTLLKTLRRLCEDSDFFYAPRDLTNIHAAIKTGNLVILSGMSGTGKSAVVDLYTRALGLRVEDDDNRVLMIPVRPSWNDDSDLLGYVDLIHMVYRASDTGFVKLLVEASKEENKNRLYFVCFDEMNLARVEHYFSQFLSVLEKPIGKRKLRLYDEQYRGQLYNSVEYPDVIELKGNVRFIGTVNIDESTYHFADKVLDRANVINLHVLPFHRWEKHPYTTKGIQEWTCEEYDALSRDKKTVLPDDLREFLWDFHQTLQSASSSMGIGPRVVKSIENYLRNLPADAGEFTISVQDGIDIQILQRVLPKIRGSSEQFEQLFNSSGNSLINLFDKYSQLSDFTESRKAIQQKVKELSVYGYCL